MGKPSILLELKKQSDKYNEALNLVANSAKILDEDIENTIDLSRKIAAATTMSLEEAAYYVSHNLLECANIGGRNKKEVLCKLKSLTTAEE